jgi:hypothetical protein
MENKRVIMSIEVEKKIEEIMSDLFLYTSLDKKL